MPTHDTVAPGLRELASFFDTHPDVLETRRFSAVTLPIIFVVRSASDVAAIAQRLGTEVQSSTVRDDVHTGTLGAFGGVTVSFVAIESAATTQTGRVA